MTVLRIVCFLSAAILTAGCTDSYGGRQAVSGKVTLEGQPLDDGQILFGPLDSQVGTSGGAGIKNGRYEIPREHGLKPGKYLVRITAGDGKTPQLGDEEAAAPGGSTNIISVDRIPAEWNINSDKQVEVKADGSNEFNFDIPKAAEIKKPKRK
jgi:hypothetical protein